MLRDLLAACNKDKKSCTEKEIKKNKLGKKQRKMSYSARDLNAEEREYSREGKNEEDKILMENIDHMIQVFTSLNTKDIKDISAEVQAGVRNLKIEIDKYTDKEEGYKCEGSSPKIVDKNQKKKRICDKSTGAIPKKFKRKVSSDSENSSFDGDILDESYDGSSESSSEKLEMRTSRSKNKDLIRLTKVLCNRGERRTPDFEKFDESSGQSLENYLKHFEEYCKSNLSGGRSGWLIELKKYLDGQTLEAFKVMKGSNDTYGEVKEEAY